MSARVRWLAAALGVSFVACGRSELSLGSGAAGSGDVDSTAGSGRGGAAAAGRGGSVPSGTGGSPAGAAGASQTCGNGVVEGSEECDQIPSDDGNCVSCQLARCGDGNVWPGHEDCDDKGLVSGDGCSASCQYEALSIHAGAQFTCALSLGGEIKCWGDATTGCLGLGDASARGAEPGQMGEALPSVDLGKGQVASWLSVSSHACAVLDHGVKCWGYNGDGELGLGDFVNRGDSPNEMGDALPWVDLGSEFRTRVVATGFDATCALAMDGRVKCWGSNLYGQLGVGDKLTRGGDPSDMGDALPYVDLGSGREALWITVGWHHACALLDSSQVKCWGSNSSGQLGLGDRRDRGNAPEDLGDALPFVNLGTDEVAGKVVANANRTCVLLTGRRIKCWGDNSGGQLGLEDKLNRGVAPDQMGDNLPAVDLGAGTAVLDVLLGVDHTCAQLVDGRVKCWGLNTDGVLGNPDILDVGGNPGDMGDNLAAVPRGASSSLSEISAGSFHTCARFENHSVKCWGRGERGALGVGDTQNRGDDPNEMGDDLPFVDLTF